MKIDRSKLLSQLAEAQVGLSSKEVIEQSNAFVFEGKKLVTFNDEICTRSRNPFNFDAVVEAPELLALLDKMPDGEIDVEREDGQLIINAKRRKAGLACHNEVRLPHAHVAKPGKWTELGEGIVNAMNLAAANCGADETQFHTTMVHVTPKMVEGTDQKRLLRTKLPTGFPDRVLIKARHVQTLKSADLKEVSLGEGWVHFKTGSGCVISLRCSHEDYVEGVDAILKMGKGAEKVQLPVGLSAALERAGVLSHDDYGRRVSIALRGGKKPSVTVSSSKDQGWYKERKRVEYSGKDLDFEVDLQSMLEMLETTRQVQVDANKMKMKAGNTEMVTALYAPKDD